MHEATSSVNNPNANERSMRPETNAWFETTVRPAKGVLLVVHGLNTKPESMDPIARYATELGYHSLRIVLSGSSPADIHGASYERWLNDLRSAYNTARSRYPDLAVSALGFSVGATLIVALADEDPGVSFRNSVFLAPAFAITPASSLLRLITPLRFLHLSVPSLAPRGYRSRTVTSLYQYKSLFDTVDSITVLRNPTALARMHAFIFASPRDRLVSLYGIHRWMERNALDWRIETIVPEPLIPYTYSHLIVDEPSLGQGGWEQMKRGIREFLTR